MERDDVADGDLTTGGAATPPCPLRVNRFHPRPGDGFGQGKNPQKIGRAVVRHCFSQRPSQ
jgi:hypothetical protein